MLRAFALLLLALVSGVSAEMISLDQTVTGSLASGDLRTPPGCLVDLFSLEVTEPQRIAVSAHSETVDLVLEFLDPVGRCWRNDDASFDTVDPRLEVDIDEPGSCLISIHAFHPREEGDYTLTVERAGD
jgi:hypothetical protein